MYDRMTLPNGVRIISERVPGVRSATIGLWVGAGSRYERKNEAGCAHFIEHMLFKGTSKYTAAALAEVTDRLGGQINAYTTRDNTCFYARVLDTQLPLCIDILSDMFFDSLFDDGDAASERGIILDEIDMYEDTPEDVCSERLMYSCFPGALGRPVLGAPSSLRRQTGGSLRAFKERMYTAPRVVISLAGSFSKRDINHIVRRFSHMSPGLDAAPEPSAYVPAFTLRRRKTEQNQLALGFPGLPTDSPRRFALQLLSGALGGGASSRLFQTVREKHGLCYSVYTYTAGYSDCGLLAVALATGKETEEQALRLIRDELSRLLDSGLTADELQRGREQIEASLLMALESTASRMNRMGYGELFMGGPLPVPEIIARYEAVTGDEVLSLARELLAPSGLSLSAVGRVAGEEEYRRLLQ